MPRPARRSRSAASAGANSYYSRYWTKGTAFRPPTSITSSVGAGRKATVEERASVGQLHQPDLAGRRPRERSLLVTEQLRLRQALRHGRAVERDERLVVAPRQAVDLVAISSFPVPDSPTTSTETSELATLATMSSAARMLASSVTISASRAPRAGPSLPGAPTSTSDLWASAAFHTSATSRSGWIGFSRKS